jgi:hypothetical protein
MIKEAITIKPWRLFMKSQPWKSRSQKGYFILRWYSFWKYVDGGYFPLGILICFKFNLIHWGCLIDFLGHWVLCGKEYNCSQSLEAPTITSSGRLEILPPNPHELKKCSETNVNEVNASSPTTVTTGLSGWWINNCHIEREQKWHGCSTCMFDHKTWSWSNVLCLCLTE